MLDEEPVTSPDQRTAGHPRAARAGAVIVILVLLSLMLGNHTTAANLWLAGIAGVLAGTLVVDWVLRKNGLRS